MLKRTVKKELDEWIRNGKEALMVTSARQTGKTYLIRECLAESG